MVKSQVRNWLPLDLIPEGATLPVLLDSVGGDIDGESAPIRSNPTGH